MAAGCSLGTQHRHPGMLDPRRAQHGQQAGGRSLPPGHLERPPVFVGTRVPVQSLFDYLEGGDTLDECLRQFPSVSREQAVAALELAKESVLTSARPA